MKSKRGLIIFFVVFAIVISGYIFQEPGDNSAEGRAKEITNTTNNAVDFLRAYHFRIKDTINHPKDDLYEHRGETIVGNTYIEAILRRFPPEFRYGFETRKNPVGAGTLVAFAHWLSRTDNTKVYSYIWLIDGDKVEAASMGTALDSLKIENLASADQEKWPQYLAAFK